MLGLIVGALAARAGDRVDFSFAPPEWQAAICLPDDPQKSLVDKSGELLYDFGAGSRGFGTRVSVQVASDAVWQKQELLSPREPIVRTWYTADGLQIVEEAFALTDVEPCQAAPGALRRMDEGEVLRNWAQPAPGVDTALRDVAVHFGGSIKYAVAGSARRIALALCEGWWNVPGKRKLILRVEGAEPRTVDTVADIGKNKAALFWFDGRDLNGDGQIDIEVEPGEDRNTILNGLWIYPADARPDGAALLAGQPGPQLLARMSTATRPGPPRDDLILTRVTNPGHEPRTFQPRLLVDTTLDFGLDGQRVTVGGCATITSSLKLAGPADQKKTVHTIPLETLTVPAGGDATFFVLYGNATLAGQLTTVGQAMERRQRAAAYWQNAPLPWGRITVPDAGIQALLDSSIRNIWQAREIKQGLPAFQVGPTCYRGLWIVDGAFLLEAAAILGAGDQARNGVAYELTHQKPDGRIEVMKDFPKENGIVLWTCVRHAQLTQDKAWLASVWPQLVRIAEYIRTLRRQTLQNASPLDDGLIPAGFPDGGIGGVHDEYTNPYWNLLGLHAFVEAAHWLGKPDEAAAWQQEYNEFMAAFRKAAARDLRKDAHGNSFLPILMGADGAKELPQRGQWGFCHAVYPGQLFAKDDPLVAGNMAMLAATEREGMVYGTGWDATGIWNYFASFYGHAWLWQGDGRKAAQILYAYANHAAPVLDWREEQSLRGEKFKKVGDMPHNWASAEFIRLTTHLLALDRGDELHLFEGLPVGWTQPGMVTRLNGIATPFGKLTLQLEIAKDGKSAALRVEPLTDASCKKIVVHLSGWATMTPCATLTLDPHQRQQKVIKLEIGQSMN
jgi:hypothetical protein